MSASLSVRMFVARRTSALLNYLHVDLAVAGLALAIVLLGGLANNGIARAVTSLLPAFQATEDVPPAPPVAQRQVKPLLPAMAAALDQVAQRYRVSPEALLPVFETAQSAARELRLDPLLVIAVIGIESGFNPISQSPMGAQGLMQIIPRYHQDKLPKAAGSRAFFDPVTNVEMGARILQEMIRRQGGLMEGLQAYAGAPDDAEQTYANKVLAEKSRLEQASRRRDGAAS